MKDLAQIFNYTRISIDLCLYPYLIGCDIDVEYSIKFFYVWFWFYLVFHELVCPIIKPLTTIQAKENPLPIKARGFYILYYI